VELYQLKAFITVAEEGHLTRAAEKLFTSQPAVSAQIKALEEALGVTLFERTPKGMRLTAHGEKLKAQALVTLDAAEALNNQARSLQNQLSGELKIGVNSDFDFLRLPSVHQKLTSDHAGVSLCLLGGVSQEIIRDIRTGTLDGGFIFWPEQPQGIATLHLFDTPMHVIAPGSWREKINNRSIEELANLPWVYPTQDCPFRSVMNALYDDIDCKPQSTICADTEEGVKAMVAGGAGLSVLRKDDALRSTQANDICIWDGSVPTIPLFFGYLQKRMSDPLLTALLASLRRTWGIEASPAQASA
jgi:DNA-binding transcriptional LysR family regulator